MEDLLNGTTIDLASADFNEIELQNVCRLCNKQEESKSKYGSTFDTIFHHKLNQNLSDIIQNHLPIKITKNDIPSLKICEYCVNEVIKWHDFYLRVIEVDNRLKNSLISLNNNGSEEPLMITGGNHTNSSYIAEQQNDILQNHNQNDDVRNLLQFNQTTNTNSKNEKLFEDIEFLHDFNCNEQYYEIGINNEVVNDILYENNVNDLTNCIGFNQNPMVINRNVDDNRDGGDDNLVDVIQENYTEVDNIEIHNEASDNDYAKLNPTWNSASNETTLTCEFCSQSSSASSSSAALKNKGIPIVNRLQFNNRLELIHHLKDKHYKLIFHCDVCDDYFDCKILIDHMTNHANDIENNKTFELLTATQSITDDKIKAVENISQKLYEHAGIKNKTKLESERQNAKRNKFMHKRSGRPYQKTKCKYCDRELSRSGMFYHIMSIHKNIRQFQCSYCGKSFPSKRVLLNHIRGIHFKNESAFLCKLCPKTFQTDSSLHAHMRVHENLYLHDCTECDKMFKFKYELRRHMVKHNNTLEYHCSVCARGFKTKQYLISHQRIHGGTLDYACQLCTYKASQKRYLAAHVQRLHSKSK